MSSRLDRLVLLLDTGSTGVVRSTAATQIGEVQRQHPGELYNLLARVVVHLRSKSWETRSAAAQALAAVAAHVAAWEPGSVSSNEGQPQEADDDRLAFSGFDIAAVVANARPLLSSGGKEFDVDLASLSAKDRVLKQKQLVKQRLGIGIEARFMDVDLVNDNDLTVKLESAASPAAREVPKQLLEIGKASSSDNMEGLSARERNALKRKAKLEAKKNSGKSDKIWAADLSSSSSNKKQKLDPSLSTPTSATVPSPLSVTAPTADNTGKVVVEHKTKEDHALSLGILGSSDEWPFEGLCEQLCIDLFNSRWEVRHGAALGLMEIIKAHGSGAGKITGVDRATNQKRHAAWLEDVSIRILCVLALDRFADYVGDHLRVPVRETCARVLGVLMQKCDADLSFRVLEDGLLKLISSASAVSGGISGNSSSSGLALPGSSKSNVIATTNNSNIEWEMRHAALIGLKYWMAVKRDLVKDVLVPRPGSGLTETGAFLAILNGLKDHNDDVRAVSSSTLLPICDLLVTLLPPSKVYKLIVSSLWNTLQELDDLTAATSSIMDLLSQLLMKDEIRQLMQSEPASSLQTNVPRLYPFFRHAITSVRIAVLKTIQSLLDILKADGGASSSSWITPDLMRLVFQNFVLEDRREIVELTSNLWTQLVDFVGGCGGKSKSLEFLTCIEGWFSLTMTPVGVALNLGLFYDYTLATVASKKGGKAAVVESHSGLNVSIQDQAMVQQDLHVVDEQDVLRGRLSAATGLGQLLHQMIVTPGIETGALSVIQNLLFGYLNSASAGHRTLVHIIIEEVSVAYYAKNINNATLISDKYPLLKSTWDAMMAGLVTADSGSQQMFNEQLPPLGRLRMECQALINAFGEYNATGCPPLPNLPFTDTTMYPPDPTNPFGTTFTYQVAERLLNEVVPQLYTLVKPRPGGSVVDPHVFINDRKTRVQIAMEKYLSETTKWETQSHASASSAVVQLRVLPGKLNPIVRSLMGSIKSEISELIQNRSACGVGKLLELSVKGTGGGKGMDKVIKNLGVYLCNEAEWGDVFSVTSEVGILSLGLNEKQAEVEVKKESGGGKKGKELNSEVISAVEAASGVIADMGIVNKVKNQVARRGAKFAFEQTCLLFGETVFDSLPKLWEIMTAGITEFSVEATVTTDLDPAALKCKTDSVFAQTVVDSLVTLATIVQAADHKLHSKLCALLRPVCRILRTPLTVLRHAAGLCIAAFAKTCTPETIKAMVENVVPLLGDASVVRRQGAIECIQLVIANLEESRLLPYIVFLIVPVLGRMSDADESVRLVSTAVFAHLVKLVPLESGVSDPEGMDSELVKLKQEERKFMGQLVGSEKVESFEIPKGIKADLRPYQKEGVSWLAFLNRYGLHGILCDDMGLGKTLQSICMLASDHHIRAAKFEETGSPEFAHIPSLVVCPPTLTGHWKQEILQYAGTVLKPLIYVGGPAERNRLRGLIPSHDVIITSYEILRNDVENLTSFTYNYCILDEGHVIKNAKTKLTKAVKTVDCKNRLILSGTPVQNNVLELWSLFDFLMPGFLGTETQFQAKFGKPILASRDAKSSSREQERGALALEALHKQVLPFLMRRMKEDVLDDLPPKIIQDFYVELGDVQKQLYEDFGKSQTGAGVVSEVKTSGAGGGRGKTGETHVFQALQYLRKLCNHPSLVLKPDHPKFGLIMDQLKAEGKSIQDVSLSPKIMALKQILQDCGIGAAEAEDSKSADTGPVTAPHRVLVFCQLREMLDHIETGLFKTHMKSVTYLRMDGTTDTSLRHEMVQKFNADPSIDVFLLTTSVGGLGLNLTGADTVIFVEHDWNPMKDLQAMDRAHRIGQKRVVNVYRLITRGTLEEKIMGLQKFKLNIASSIINQDNAGIESMDTNQILDLFSLGAEGKASSNEPVDPNKKASTKEILEGLGQLWDEKQYESFDDMGDFLKGLQ
ncbi:UNVERIFIED_CONTAM: btaf1 RNA polymerase II, B-TFIID transcription factor-associated, 170kDa [Siphonaria sp. JEL0065]|nr:btaf1 RNA polymerase II, B-TFIID transcription factor-associated, 170kDa [Siphonaria sp. JEL0065]